jgi:hypothetical protein
VQYGGLGHTASIHSQNEAAVKEFGLGVPAFRVVVNSSSVHGSIGYSTNLFPAMTLGCGSPGGNITSDNIGPQHLMNIKRVAWESRAVEHRTIPAAERMGQGLVGGASLSSAGATREAALADVAAAAGAGTAAGQVLDRQTIARIVERVFTERGIARGSASKPQAAPAPEAMPHRPAENFAQAMPAAAAAGAPKSMEFKPPPQAAEPQKLAPAIPAPSPQAQAPLAAPPKPSQPPIQIAEFVSESDVRTAIGRGEKIYLGPKTIVTPSARDLADANEVFVVAEVVRPSSSPKTRAE